MIATGEQHSVREFVDARRARARHARSTGAARASTSTRSTRPPARPSCASTRATSGPTEVDTLLGDASKARRAARLDAEVELRRAGARDGRRGLDSSPSATRSIEREGFPCYQHSRMNASDATHLRRGRPRPRRLRDLRALARARLHATCCSAPRAALDLRDQAAVERFFATSGPSTCSWPRPRSAASSRTTPTPPISSATIC